MEKFYKQRKLSIVIPVLDEQENINSLIDQLKNTNNGEDFEIIVVDGDSDGGTVEVIRDNIAKTLISEKGRGCQMNAGAAAASGEILVFLHADTRLPSKALAKISDVMKSPGYVAGAFDLGIDTDRLFLKFIAACGRLLSRLNRVPYGDQAIFIRKEYFERMGGFREIALMEDVELMRRIKKRGDKIFILRERAMTSARRWETDGVIYTTLLNQILVGLYYLGVSPEKLARYYKSSCTT